ncbi:hypothetical protein [Ochrobactrum soli]|uniref:Phage tail fiber protein n=1 Tax=Ochrobactrum soli TaxID=2448455 RepID=A0A2P9HMY7_9HYPH|nr:hypothetical protein [[Ochrobactrum] soli]SPL65343.1 hypothetical protein OHAE_1210 [[Ochrobactrum] soli]
MSDLSSFLSTQNKAWSTQLWDGLIEAIGARLAPLEENLGIQREVTDAIIARGLTVIEQELAPIVAQADEILSESTAEITAKLERFEQKVTGGTVIAMSTSSASLSNGATINLTLVVEDREFFAPTPYLALSRASTTANWALAKVNSFNRSTGALSITLEQVTGAGGPYTDWVITSLPAATLIQKAYLEQTLLAKTAAEGSASASASSAAASQASRVKSEEARDQSVTAKAGSESALTATQGVLAEARMMIAEPLVPPAAPVEGQLWWDGSVVRVFDGVAFVPTVTASIGGLRFESGVVGDLIDATFTVGGGFSSLMLFVNGVLQVAGTDYTATSPDVVLNGDYADTDLYYVWAYQAIDSTDYDTKEQVNDKIDEALTEKAVCVDVAQAHTPAERGQARANIDAGILAGFRNKIINGSFDIWQRGGSFTVPAGSSAYTSDRWIVYNTTNQPCTVSRFVLPNNEPGNSMLIVNFGVAPTSGEVAFIQRIEGAKTLAGRIATCTADLIAPFNANVRIGVSRRLSSSVDDGIIDEVTIPTFTSGGGIVRKQVLLDIPNITKTDTLNADYLELFITVMPRDAGNYALGRVSLVEGDVTAEDDPFSPRHIQQELALCQRYFVSLGEGVYSAIGVGAWRSLREVDIVVNLPQPMRVQPSFNINPLSGFCLITGKSNGNTTLTAIYNVVGSTTRPTLRAAIGSDMGDTSGALLTANEYGNARITFDAEL